MSNTPTALVTGASSGFGLLTGKELHRRGWNVIASMRDPAKAGELAQLPNVQIAKLDVTDRASIDAAVAAGLSRFGRIDSLVNNAGYGAFGFLEEASEQDISRQLNTNLLGVINCIQAVLPSMRAQRSGSIINITSIGGRVGMPMLSLYSTTKFAVEGLSESLSHELAAFGIQVKLVEPGSFATGFGDARQYTEQAATPELDSLRDSYKNHLSQMLSSPPKPFGLGDPQEVANLIADLADNPAASKLHNPVGKDAKLLLLIRRWLGATRVLKMVRQAGLPKNFKAIG